MEDVLIKGVGKKIYLKDNILEINKTIGKNVIIPLSCINNAAFEKGTLSKNGTIQIEAVVNGKAIKEIIMFYYSYNDIVEKVVNWLNNNPLENEISISNKKISFFKQINNEAKESIEESNKAKEKLKQYDTEGIPYCPKCYSTSIQYLDRRKQLSLGRAVVGGALFGGIGAAIGGVTSKKYKGKLKCLKCGHEWKL